eukprot:gb/GEZN01009073.1/.p1 GENE.gb/GEZN01009073.1/~~gb/GEZN01009073.1/.p1  ORF type:complete len:335 (+),score=18.10 gb/GEZN01009073.1/:53-1057(+)
MEPREVAPEVYQIDLSKPRYNQKTYWGRVYHFIDIINPATLFTSEETLKKSIQLLEAQKNHDLDPTVTVEDLYRAKAIKESILHPQTGQPIFPLFRMSCFVPMNFPIVAGMLSSTTMPSTIFWQWYNQSYNVAMNHANRNASNEMSNESIMKAYTGAVTSSVAIVLGLNHCLKRAEQAKISPSLLSACRALLPFSAVAGAGCLNVYLMRRNETTDGITVQDENGNDVGVSVIAGQMAVSQSALTRVVLPIPILILPPAILAGLQHLKCWPHSPRLAALSQLFIITACLSGALPLSIALFPQTCDVPVTKLEPKFQNLRDEAGHPVQTLYFNRGL